MKLTAKRIFLFLLVCLMFSGCLSKKKGIIYDEELGLKLDVYSPVKKEEKKEVLVFIHGGNWRAGKRSLYRFFGKGMARKGLVSVVIDYRLSKVADYRGMTMDAAKAIRWIRQHASAFGGDSSRIFVSGHSAGGHIGALVATDPSYFEALHMSNPVRGVILIDAFGLDMYSYLKNSDNKMNKIYYPAFTEDPEVWKKASPVNYLTKDSPPMLLFVGTKTYPVIKKDNERFLGELKKYRPGTELIWVKGKKHLAMIGRYYYAGSRGYRDVLDFIKHPSSTVQDDASINKTGSH